MERKEDEKEEECAEENDVKTEEEKNEGEGKAEEIEQSVDQTGGEKNMGFVGMDGVKVSRGVSHDDSEVGVRTARVHQRSSSWSGVQHELVSSN